MVLDRQAWPRDPLRGRLGLTNATKREETMKAFLRLFWLSAAAGVLLVPAGDTRRNHDARVKAGEGEKAAGE